MQGDMRWRMLVKMGKQVNGEKQNLPRIVFEHILMGHSYKWIMDNHGHALKVLHVTCLGREGIHHKKKRKKETFK